jgi:hypothetical protein
LNRLAFPIAYGSIRWARDTRDTSGLGSNLKYQHQKVNDIYTPTEINKQCVLPIYLQPTLLHNSDCMSIQEAFLHEHWDLTT